MRKDFHIVCVRQITVACLKVIQTTAVMKNGDTTAMKVLAVFMKVDLKGAVNLNVKKNPQQLKRNHSTFKNQLFSSSVSASHKRKSK